MNPTEEIEDFDVITRPVQATRLSFLVSLAFWPFFLVAVLFMLDPPAHTLAALRERRALIDGTWAYPLAVALAWFLCRAGIKRGASDFTCLLPWLIPTSLAVYWVTYFFL